MPNEPPIRSYWTEACRSGGCSICNYSGEVLEFDLGGMLVRFCNDCATELLEELHRNGIRRFKYGNQR